MFWEPIEVHRSLWVHKTTFDGCNFGGLYLFHKMFVFNKICCAVFPLKSSYCGEIFMSIRVVLNFWEQFEVQNPDIFGLQWTLAAYFFFIQCPFPIRIVVKVAHTSLVCVAKIWDQSKKLWVTKKHFIRRRFSQRCVFCNYFLTFQIHFANSMRQSNDIFFHQCIYMMVLNHLIIWSFFICVGLEIEIRL